MYIVYCFEIITPFMGTHLHLFFYACLRLGIRMWRLIRARGVLFPLCAEYSVVIFGVCPGTLVTCPWSRLSLIYCCVPRHWSRICTTCQSCWFLDLVALLCCAGTRCLEPCDRMCEMDLELFANTNCSVFRYILNVFAAYSHLFTHASVHLL